MVLICLTLHKYTTNDNTIIIVELKYIFQNDISSVKLININNICANTHFLF